jgi:hypothetical protein
MPCAPSGSNRNRRRIRRRGRRNKKAKQRNLVKLQQLSISPLRNTTAEL